MRDDKFILEKLWYRIKNFDSFFKIKASNEDEKYVSMSTKLEKFHESLRKWKTTSQIC